MSTPEALYRNAIDLNRYSNSVARRVINAYNDIIIDAVNQLRGIDDLAAPVKAARLRAILAQLKDSLGTWAGDATELTALELQGIAQLQSEFVTDQLARALPVGARDAVRTVEISPQFAQSVVTTDPTQINVVALSDDLFAAVQGAPQTFSLTAAQGATITLPNGQVVSKAFRGIAVDQAERFNQVVRQGLLTGEPTQDIAKRLVGNLQFGEEFEYGKGPTPPQHFNCRSTTVPVVNYDELGFTPPPPAKRASAGGQVPADQTYGQWLAKQDLETKAKALGASKVPYFNRLVEKHGPTNAIAKLVRDDGSELTLEQLRARYGPA
jgi:hypothetical protein